MGTWEQLVQRAASAAGWLNNAAAASRELQMGQGSGFVLVISEYWFSVAVNLLCRFISARSRIVSVQHHNCYNQGSCLKLPWGSHLSSKTWAGNSAAFSWLGKGGFFLGFPACQEPRWKPRPHPDSHTQVALLNNIKVSLHCFSFRKQWTDCSMRKSCTNLYWHTTCSAICKAFLQTKHFPPDLHQGSFHVPPLHHILAIPRNSSQLWWGIFNMSHWWLTRLVEFLFVCLFLRVCFFVLSSLFLFFFYLFLISTYFLTSHTLKLLCWNVHLCFMVTSGGSFQKSANSRKRGKMHVSG